jgi:hypothetical protein
VITQDKENWNRASYAFNLRRAPLRESAPFKSIYDFFDESGHAANKKFSSIRFEHYKQMGDQIEARLPTNILDIS